MIRLVLREYREAPSVWGSVLLTVLVAQCSLSTVLMLLLPSLYTETTNGDSGSAQMSAMRETLSLSLWFAVVAAIIVVMQTVASAVRQRRKALSLLVLQGATSSQLTQLVCACVGTLAMVSMPFSLGGGAALSAFLRPHIAQFLHVEVMVMPDARYGFGIMTIVAWLLAAALSVVTSLIGSLFVVRPIARISAMEVFQDVSDHMRPVGLPRRISAVSCTVVALLLYVVPIVRVRTLSPTEVAGLTSGEVLMPVEASLTFAPIVLLAAICLVGADALRVVTAACVRIVPIRSAEWRLAGIQTCSHIRRAASSIVPLIVGESLLMTVDGYYLVGAASSRVLPGNIDIESADLPTLLVLLGPALAVCLAGVAAGFILAMRSRGRDLALLALAGTSNRQLNVLSALEGCLVGMASTLIAFLVALVSNGVYAVALRKVLGASIFAMPWVSWLWLCVIVAVAGAWASWLTAYSAVNGSPVGYIRTVD